jgi:hypothetical protein
MWLKSYIRGNEDHSFIREITSAGLRTTLDRVFKNATSVEGKLTNEDFTREMLTEMGGHPSSKPMNTTAAERTSFVNNKNIFIIHGHDTSILLELPTSTPNRYLPPAEKKKDLDWQIRRRPLLRICIPKRSPTI